LLARIRNAGRVLLNADAWDRWGRNGSSEEEAARVDAEATEASRNKNEATQRLIALVAETRQAASRELDAWVAAHDAYLAAFLDECATRGEAKGTAAFVANEERTAWAEVKAGSKPFVDENFYYVTMNVDRYRALFGIDPYTLAEC